MHRSLGALTVCQFLVPLLDLPTHLHPRKGPEIGALMKKAKVDVFPMTVASSMKQHSMNKAQVSM